MIMRRIHRRTPILFDLLAAVAGRRRGRLDAGALRESRPDARIGRLRLRFSERLRDLFRPGWLRLSRASMDGDLADKS
jgi:hypothetical protein